jgi:hypothetical protein
VKPKFGKDVHNYSNFTGSYAVWKNTDGSQTSICSTAVSYDANGNTVTYDADGAGPIQPRTLTDDGENRPLTITQNRNVSAFSWRTGIEELRLGHHALFRRRRTAGGYGQSKWPADELSGRGR